MFLFMILINVIRCCKLWTNWSQWRAGSWYCCYELSTMMEIARHPPAPCCNASLEKWKIIWGLQIKANYVTTTIMQPWWIALPCFAYSRPLYTAARIDISIGKYTRSPCMSSLHGSTLATNRSYDRYGDIDDMFKILSFAFPYPVYILGLIFSHQNSIHLSSRIVSCSLSYHITPILGKKKSVL